MSGSCTVSPVQGSSLAAPGPIGGTTPAAGTFTTIEATSTLTLDGNVTLSKETAHTIAGAASTTATTAGAATAYVAGAGTPAASGVAAGAGGTISNTGGAGGAAHASASAAGAAGGNAENIGGVGGAAAAHAGGTAGAGGVAKSNGGVGGAASANAAGGIGGASQAHGGRGGAGSAAQAAGAGGALSLQSGGGGADGGGGGAASGGVGIDTGAATGAATNGSVGIGTTNAEAVSLGRTGKNVNVDGILAIAAGASLAGTGPAAAADKVSYGVADINGATTAAEKTIYEGGGSDMRRVMSAAGAVKRMTWAQSVADDGTIALPVPTAVGRVRVTSFDEEAVISTKADGTCTLLYGSANIDDADTDTKLCVYDNGGVPTVKNRLGGARDLIVEYTST